MMLTLRHAVSALFSRDACLAKVLNVDLCSIQQASGWLQEPSGFFRGFDQNTLGAAKRQES